MADHPSLRLKWLQGLAVEIAEFRHKVSSIPCVDAPGCSIIQTLNGDSTAPAKAVGSIGEEFAPASQARQHLLLLADVLDVHGKDSWSRANRRQKVS